VLFQALLQLLTAVTAVFGSYHFPSSTYNYRLSTSPPTMISHCAGGIVIDSSKRKVAGMSSVPNFLDCFGSATLVPQYYSASVYATCTPVF